MRIASLLLLALAACSSVRPHVGSADPRPGIGDRGVPTDSVPETAIPRVRRSVDDVRPRIQCRSRAVPSGWVVVSYESSSSCPRTPRDDYNAAVIEPLAPHRVGATLTICADQPIPRGWVLDGAAPLTGCAGARVGEGAATSIVIARVR